MASEENIISQKSQLLHTLENANTVETVESRLNSHVQDAMTQTVERYLQYIKLGIFKETFLEIYKKNKTHLKEIHKQFLIQLKDTFLDEAKDICNTSDLHNSLYLLDSLITKYEDKIGEESWRPSGIPSKDSRDHMHQVKLKQKKCLEFILQTSMTENESIEKILKEKHQQIINKKSSIEHKNLDIKKFSQVIHDGSLACLEKEMVSNQMDYT